MKQREHLRGATRIAAPGCNASTVSLSLAPGVAAGVIDPADIVSVLAVGPSGAGKSLKTNLLGSEILGTANPYAVGGTHRHIPEIRQALARGVRGGCRGHPHLVHPGAVPMSRGILATSTAPIVDGATDAQIRDAWQSAYGDETFVQLLPEGRFPRTADVLGANTALIGLAIDRAANRVTVVTAVDNLVKGTAGAAIQSMNIALGLPENRALSVNGVAPVSVTAPRRIRGGRCRRRTEVHRQARCRRRRQPGAAQGRCRRLHEQPRQGEPDHLVAAGGRRPHRRGRGAQLRRGELLHRGLRVPDHAPDRRESRRAPRSERR